LCTLTTLICSSEPAIAVHEHLTRTVLSVRQNSPTNPQKQLDQRETDGRWKSKICIRECPDSWRISSSLEGSTKSPSVAVMHVFHLRCRISPTYATARPHWPLHREYRVSNAIIAPGSGSQDLRRFTCDSCLLPFSLPSLHSFPSPTTMPNSSQRRRTV
jgi:hypothetical protein